MLALAGRALLRKTRQRTGPSAARAVLARRLLTTPSAARPSPYPNNDPQASPSRLLAAAIEAAESAPNKRTVFIGNIREDTTTQDLCNAIRLGALQRIVYNTHQAFAFVTFMDPTAALAFYIYASVHGVWANRRRLHVAWSKNAEHLPPILAEAVQKGASRCVYVGNIENWETFSEERLTRDFANFGVIEHARFLRDMNAGWIHFENLYDAVKAVTRLGERLEYTEIRLGYGTDRCARMPRPRVEYGRSSRYDDNNVGTSSAVLAGPGAGLELDRQTLQTGDIADLSEPIEHEEDEENSFPMFDHELEDAEEEKEEEEERSFYQQHHIASHPSNERPPPDATPTDQRFGPL